MSVYPNDWRRKLRELQVKRYKKEKIYHKVVYVIFYLGTFLIGVYAGIVLEHNFSIIYLLKGIFTL
jgi:polyferredoxin